MQGIVLLALLLALALCGIAAMAAADLWSLERQRAREQELLFVGDQYRVAIQRYYHAAPVGTARVLPSRVEDLLEDDRFPTPLHHLRRAYPDPITGSAEWGQVKVGNRLSGVHSLSEKTPVKQAGFGPAHELFNGSSSYRQWVFVVSSTGAAVTTLPAPASAPGGGVAPTDPPRPVLRTTP
ncbi:MAG: type II secretion system protein [Burkholderiales bacterium]